MATTTKRTATKAAARTAKTAKTAKKAAARTATKTVKAAKKATAPAKRAASTRRASTTTTKRGGTTRRRSGAPDALELLIADHHEVEALFARFEKTGKSAHKQRRQLVDRISVALSRHAGIEEDVFYPAARDEAPETVDDVLEALEEHHLVKVTLAELHLMDPGDERYAAKVRVLIESVRHHVKEEEGELFPRLRRELGASRLQELGGELAVAKRSAPTRPHPEAPDEPPANIVAQAISAPFDAAANLTETTARRVRELVT